MAASEQIGAVLSKGAVTMEQQAKGNRGTLIVSFLEDGVGIILLVFLSVAMLIFVFHMAMALFHRYPMDYGESPLVDQAMRLASGQGIYRSSLSSPPYTISNYPPLYVLVLTPFVKLFGPNFWAGRVISVASTLASAAFLALIVYTYSQDRLAAIVTGLVFLSIPYVVGWSIFARVDMLALALSTAGLYVVARWPKTWQERTRTSASRRLLGLVGASLLLVAAAYTRQSYGLAAPLAAFVWLLTQDWRQALKLAGLVGGVGLGLFLILNVLTGGGFFYNIVTANVNEFSMERLRSNWRALWQTAYLLLIIGGVSLFVTPRRVKVWSLLIPYLIGSCLSAATIGKIGSNVNYLLELSAALALAAGVLLAWTRQRPWLRILMLLVLALQVGQLMKATLEGPVESAKWRLYPGKELEDLEWTVQTADGPVLADEFMGLLTLQGRSLYFQPFEVTQLANAGLWDQADLLASIRNREFPIVLIHHFMDWPVYKERWTPEMLSAIIENYAATDSLASTIVFRPRDVESGPAGLESCPGAPWRLPTRGDMGMWWQTYQLGIMGEGRENTVPVYAVADGLLLRRPDWNAAVAIQHDDPVRPGEKVWSFYGDMASSIGESFIVPDFPLGSEGVPVQAGQLLGYQGTWSGSPGSAIWTHLQFAVVPAEPDGSFPAEIVGLAPEDEFSPEDVELLPDEDESSARDEVIEFALDPSPYLGTVRSQVMGTPDWLPVRCQ
jgi:hypothetical protein